MLDRWVLLPVLAGRLSLPGLLRTAGVEVRPRSDDCVLLRLGAGLAAGLDERERLLYSGVLCGRAVGRSILGLVRGAEGTLRLS